MLKGKSIIGKELLSRADGQKIGSIKDILIAKDHTQLLGVLTDEGGLFSKARAVTMPKILSFGKDAVVVTDTTSEVEVANDPTLKESFDSKDSLVGKNVFTERGDQQAKVSDIYFDEASGKIVGLELSGGVLENSADGTAYLPLEEIISIGQDAVVIRAEAVSGLLQQASGTQSTARAQQNPA